ncbi:MAG: hypothetical protein CL933_16420 [Deltaproteobacteria bacterium]|nr:hypothetical protein [Deltaproteobacteria bacterium]
MRGEANPVAPRSLGPTMSSGAEFAGQRPQGDEARSDESEVRILLVEDRTVIAEQIQQSLGRTSRVSFDVVCETSLVRAAAQIEGDRFDLLLVDPMLPGDLARPSPSRIPPPMLRT